MFVTPSISVTPFNIIWFPHILDYNQIAYTPRVDETAGVAVRKYIEKGWVQGSLGERSTFENNVVAKLKWEHQLTSKTVTRYSLNYHKRADETDILLIAGMENEAIARFETKFDEHNTYDGSFRAMQFLGQDRSYLGTGEEVSLHWQNKFYLEYPDWNINFYGTWAKFQNSNRPISKKLQRFVPADQTANTQFFVPQGYTEGGITFGFGQEYKEGYTHAWRPFAEAGLLYSHPFGLGQLAEAGIAGSVFGRDHLALFAEYGTNQQQASQEIYTIGIRYEKYF
jgi:hypothetical protein